MRKWGKENEKENTHREHTGFNLTSFNAVDTSDTSKYKSVGI